MNVMRAILQDEQHAQLYDALKVHHMRFAVLWLLGCGTGLRIGDLLTLRAGDVKKLLHVTERKTKKERVIDLNPAMLNLLRHYIKSFGLCKADFLFYSSSNRLHRPMCREWADVVIARTARRIGLEAIGTHSMRKTYACNLYRAHGSVEAVQRIMRHKNKSTTETYLADVLA